MWPKGMAATANKPWVRTSYEHSTISNTWGNTPQTCITRSYASDGDKGLPLSFQGKGNIVICLTKYHTIKPYPLVNQAPCHEDIFGEWRYSSMPRLFYPQGKTLVPTGLDCTKTTDSFSLLLLILLCTVTFGQLKHVHKSSV